MGEGVWSGLAGMVEKPLEAAKEGGAAGLLQGIGQGLLGALTKPAAGVLLLGSKVTEGTVAQVRRTRDGARCGRHVTGAGAIRRSRA